MSVRSALLCFALLSCSSVRAQESPVPFSLSLTPAEWAVPHHSDEDLPAIQSFALGTASDGAWVVLCGRVEGLHGFNDGSSSSSPPSSNFAKRSLNDRVFVIEPGGGVWAKDLVSVLPASALDLRVTNPQSVQVEGTLVITGGYGYTSDGSSMETKAVLTAIDVDSLAAAVKAEGTATTATSSRLEHAAMKVTGGELLHDDGTYYLAFGQDFAGFYTPTTNGNYTFAVRTFGLGGGPGTPLELSGLRNVTLQGPQNALLRRRDLNVVPTLRGGGEWGFTVLGGVFTMAGGAFLNPVQGVASGGDTTLHVVPTFEQQMGQYDAANLSVWADGAGYAVIFGGIGLKTYDPRTKAFKADSELPFVGQVSCVQETATGFAEFLMLDGAGGPLQFPGLMGAEAKFIPLHGFDGFDRDVLRWTPTDEPTLIGHIYGGIEASGPNRSATSASAKVFEVRIARAAGTSAIPVQ